jgi:hypothetical protein
VTVQVLFCARVAVHVVVRLKSPVAAETDIPLIAPLFAVSVTVCPALVVFVTWLVKLSELGDRPTAAGSTPVPVRLTVCGLPVPEDVMVIAPVRVPATVGENVTVTVHVPFRARVAVQVVVRLKSPVAAEIEIPLIAPLFAVSVTVWPALVVPVL